MHSIGELARHSGLTVSALRFYDGAGVLVPSWVDPASGYRWYAPEQLEDARLLARLRRVQLPLADIRLLLAGWASEDTSLVRGLLEAHLRRLEDGLAGARRELSAVSALLALRETPVSSTATSDRTTPNTRVTLPARDLAAALDQVRFAAATDPELPMLCGVLFDAESGAQAGAGALRLVATDRYRMSLAGAAATALEGPAVRAIVPTVLVDAMRALLGGRADANADLLFDGGRITLEVDGSQAAGQSLDFDFPDYRRLSLLPAGRRLPVRVPALQEALLAGASVSREREQDGVGYDLSLLSVAEDGTITVVTEAEAEAETETGADARTGAAARAAQARPGTVFGVNRGFLLEALRVGGRDDLVLELGDPMAPLAIRPPEPEASAFSLLMPVRLEG
ncbi:MerR family transcriptional regulator [Streptacidiphilus sp. 4-A2]|nr:MerR family transcriptional regulator [Streptacidiphilus sp. 4-A2]